MDILVKTLTSSLPPCHSQTEGDVKKVLAQQQELLRNRCEVLVFASQAFTRQQLGTNPASVESTELLNVLYQLRDAIPAVNAMVALQIQASKFKDVLGEAFVFTAMHFLPRLSPCEISVFPAEGKFFF